MVALTGSTGTGKSETAWVLAEAMLTKRCRISGGTRDIPRGLLVFKWVLLVEFTFGRSTRHFVVVFFCCCTLVCRGSKLVERESINLLGRRCGVQATRCHSLHEINKACLRVRIIGLRTHSFVWLLYLFLSWSVGLTTWCRPR